MGKFSKFVFIVKYIGVKKFLTEEIGVIVGS